MLTSYMGEFTAIILAGGKGVRMNGEITKVLQKIQGKPLLFWTLELLDNVGVRDRVVVTGFKSEEVEREVIEAGLKATFAKQSKPLGTANATKVGLSRSSNANNILVVYGDDSALYITETIRGMLDFHLEHGGPITLLTLPVSSPQKVGGVEKNDDGNIIDVLSVDEMKEMEIIENEVLCGAFCFRSKWLKSNIKKIKKGKLKGEYPLPVLIKMAGDQRQYARSFKISDPDEWSSVNTLQELREADKKKKRMLAKHG